MTAVSIQEAVHTFPELLRDVDQGPVVIRDGEADVAFLVNKEAWSERAQKMARLEESRDRVVTSLTRKLNEANINYVDFVDQILREL